MIVRGTSPGVNDLEFLGGQRLRENMISRRAKHFDARRVRPLKIRHEHLRRNFTASRKPSRKVIGTRGKSSRASIRQHPATTPRRVIIADQPHLPILDPPVTSHTSREGDLTTPVSQGPTPRTSASGRWTIPRLWNETLHRHLPARHRKTSVPTRGPRHGASIFENGPPRTTGKDFRPCSNFRSHHRASSSSNPAAMAASSCRGTQISALSFEGISSP